jgi:hypothetical protein
MLDEATRPRAPRQHPEESVSPAGAQGQRTLLAIHGHLRDELDRVVSAVEAVAAGELSAGDARAVVHDSTMLRNYRLTGSFCAQYCRFVEGHHSIEDAYLFPSLEATRRWRRCCGGCPRSTRSSTRCWCASTSCWSR